MTGLAASICPPSFTLMYTSPAAPAATASPAARRQTLKSQLHMMRTTDQAFETNQISPWTLNQISEDT